MLRHQRLLLVAHQNHSPTTLVARVVCCHSGRVSSSRTHSLGAASVLASYQRQRRQYFVTEAKPSCVKANVATWREAEGIVVSSLTLSRVGGLPLWQPSRRRVSTTSPQRDDSTRKTTKSAPLLSTKSHQSEQIVVYALCGNLLIAAAKGFASAHSGSSAMLSEAVHSIVDAGNQALLLVGLRLAAKSPSATHPYGYGKSVYLWSLVSALGTFWLGGGVSIYSAISELRAGSALLNVETLPTQVFAVLGVSFCVDGFVLMKSTRVFLNSKPKDRSAWTHLKRTRDPTVLAVLLEDAAACVGVVVAASGVFAAHYFEMPALDAVSGLLVGCLLGFVGFSLARLNGRYLIGSAVEPAVLKDIHDILTSRPSVDAVHSVQSTVVGPDAFSYKCEVDFDAAWLARRLAVSYEPLLFETLTLSNHHLDHHSSSDESEQSLASSSSSLSGGGDDDEAIMAAKKKKTQQGAVVHPPVAAAFDSTTLIGADDTHKERRRRLRRLLALYAEDVMTTLEHEVRDVEHHIRLRHPAALFIEIEPAAALKDATGDDDDDDNDDDDEATDGLDDNDNEAFGPLRAQRRPTSR